MPVLVSSKSSSYSSRSVGGSSSVGFTGGMRFQSGSSVTSSASRAQSGTSSLGAPCTTAAFSNDKYTMQNLNDRLASYLEKVQSLEAANQKLEMQIRELYEKRTQVDGTDLTVYFRVVADLRDQIMVKMSQHQMINLQVDNARLAADEYKSKYEMELNMRMTVEADLARLRGAQESLITGKNELEVLVESLREELVDIKRNHEEEMQLIQAQQSGDVNVEMDCATSVDLTKVLQEIRAQYETMVQNNQQEVEKWFQNKVTVLQTNCGISTIDVRTSQTELSDLKKIYQTLEIELQGMHSMKQHLEQSSEDVQTRYSSQLSQFQLHINVLEAELQQLTVSIQQQAIEYQLLLDIKMRLELEIAEYRRLLDGEAHGSAAMCHVTEEVMVVEEVKVVEEHKPHIERRVKTIVEQLVDGKVVSSSVDTQVHNIQ